MTLAMATSLLFAKQTNALPTIPLNPSGTTESFSSSLLLLNTDGSTILADGNLAQYNSSFNAGVDYQDATKLNNMNETFALLRNGIKLAIERRPIIGNTDTLFFSLTQTTQRSYQFRFVATSLNHPNLVGFFKDSYTGDSLMVNLNGSTTVNFSINADAASQNPTRFMVVFEQAQPDAGPLPVTFTNIKASQQNSNVSINWNVQNEMNIKSYTVEKSTDGKTFSNIATVNASQLDQYSWTDANATTGQSYYRVCSTGSNGELQYSQVVKVSVNAVNSGIVIYPNPVRNGSLGLQFTNMPKGTYSIKMLSIAGQVIVIKTITHAGGSTTENIAFNKNIAKDEYEVEITNKETNSRVVYKAEYQ